MANCSNLTRNCTLFEIVASLYHNIDYSPCFKISVYGLRADLLFNYLERLIEEFIDITALILFNVGVTLFHNLMHSLISLLMRTLLLIKAKVVIIAVLSIG
jgi:hypothetical protein